MLTKVRVLSTAAVLVAAGSAGALADFNPAGTYMGTPLNPQPAAVVAAPAPSAPAPTQTAQATYPTTTAPTTPAPTTTGTMPNNYSPYGAASPVITGKAPEGSGTNPYQSGVGTSGHAPAR